MNIAQEKVRHRNITPTMLRFKSTYHSYFKESPALQLEVPTNMKRIRLLPKNETIPIGVHPEPANAVSKLMKEKS